jgi:hypothetical protein
MKTFKYIVLVLSVCFFAGCDNEINRVRDRYIKLDNQIVERLELEMNKTPINQETVNWLLTKQAQVLDIQKTLYGIDKASSLLNAGDAGIQTSSILNAMN